MTCTILVVEDEEAISELISVNLSFVGHKVICAGDTLQAEKLIQAALPDLILLDWMLPGTNGSQYAKHLRSTERTKLVPIIMLTARSSEEYKIEGLESGADDYITKPFSPKELIARIKAVLRRRAPQLTDDYVSQSGIVLDPITHRVSGDGKPLYLGPTEFKLLHFFLCHAERVYSRSQLLDHVWGDHIFVEERTVDVHIRRLRKALIPTSHHIHIETIRGSGYRFTADPAKET
jgi:two-component system phosphate regulon response regulator PhoB